jgi:hypothetical protein
MKTHGGVDITPCILNIGSRHKLHMTAALQGKGLQYALDELQSQS